MRHVERGYADLEAAEDHRVVGRDRRADSGVDRHRLDQLGPATPEALYPEPRENRVVRDIRCGLERDRSRVRVAEVVDVEDLLAAAVGHDEVAGRRIHQRAGAISVLERDRQGERLERRSGLPLGLGREIERGVLVVLLQDPGGVADDRPADHRSHLARPVVDRNQRSHRPALAVGEDLRDRLFGRLLEL